MGKAKRNALTVLLVTAAVMMPMTSLTAVSQYKSAPSNKHALDFPFEVKEELRFDSIDKWYIASVVIPREYFSKQNLEKLFQHISETIEEMDRIVRLTVYAGEEAYSQYKVAELFSKVVGYPGVRLPDRDGKINSNRAGWGSAHAWYERECKNEYYTYIPDLDKPKKELVILKGRQAGIPDLRECKHRSK